MFDIVSKRITDLVAKLSKSGKLNEGNIEEGVKEIRLALLEADVNLDVVNTFIEHLRKEAVGEKIIKSVSPTDQFIKVVYDHLVTVLGNKVKPLELGGRPPSVILMVGLQGSGKTTTTAKIANYLKSKENKNVLLVAADTYRPAAQEQLSVLAEKIGVPIFKGEPKDSPESIAKRAIKYAKKEGISTIIIDSAGRLEIDDKMMKELVDIKKIVEPKEILFVCDSMAGQRMIQVVEEFNKKLTITGAVLTKFDSDARGGIALSINQKTGIGIKFVGVGEKIEDLEQFHPDRLAGRILGKGDIVSLVEKAQEVVDQEEAEKLEEKMLNAQFDLEDFLSQLKKIKKMGPLQKVLGMFPGMGNMDMSKVDDKQLVRTEAIIQSMTKYERQHTHIINNNRKIRIARGSGTKVNDVNTLLKNFANMQKMMKRFMRNPASMMSMLGGAGNLEALEKTVQKGFNN